MVCGGGAESAIHHKPHSVHSLPGNTLRVVPLCHCTIRVRLVTVVITEQPLYI